MEDSQRAEYGRGVITSLSKRLSDEYGNGFSATNLKTMRQFYLCFPKGHALRDKLSWTHWRTLLKVQDEVARERQKEKGATPMVPLLLFANMSGVDRY